MSTQVARIRRVGGRLKILQRADISAASFPLTPALSLGERETMSGLLVANVLGLGRRFGCSHSPGERVRVGTQRTHVSITDIDAGAARL